MSQVEADQEKAHIGQGITNNITKAVDDWLNADDSEKKIIAIEGFLKSYNISEQSAEKKTLKRLFEIKTDDIMGLWKQFTTLENQVKFTDACVDNGINHHSLNYIAAFLLHLSAISIKERAHKAHNDVISAYKQEYEFTLHEDKHIYFDVVTYPTKTSIPYLDGKTYCINDFMVGWFQSQKTNFALYGMALSFYADYVLDGINWARAVDKDSEDSEEKKDERSGD